MKKLLLHWPLFCIFSIWFIFASPYFLKGLVPFPSRYLVSFFPPWSAAYGMPVKNNAMPDVMTQIYPWKKLTIETWKKGQVPLWNPYSFSGTPHAANYQSAVFSPLNLLFFILPFIDAWSVMVLLQPLLAGVFMYLFLREFERSQRASFLGSTAFMFCGFLVVWMAYGTLGYTVLWLPLLLLAVYRQMRKPSWWNLVILTVGLALSFFSGHFQMSIYVVVIVFAWILFQTLANRKWKTGGILLLFFGLGIVLSMPQLLLSISAYHSSVRSNLFDKNAIPWQYFVTVFAPDFYGNPVTRNDWFGQYAEWASYFGVIPLILSLYEFFRTKSSHERFFIIMAIATVLLAFSTPVNDLLFRLRIPVLSTSAASRIIVLFSFSLSVLASFGLDNVEADWKSTKARRFIFLSAGVGAGIVVLWLLLIVGRVMPLDKIAIAKRNLILPTFFSFFVLVSFLSGSFIRQKNIRSLLLYAFVFMSAFDLLRYASKWMPFDPKEFVFPYMPVISVLQKKVGINRVVGNFGGELSLHFSIPSLEGYDAVYQARYGEFIRAVWDGNVREPERSIVRLDKNGKFSEEVLALLGVRYILHRLSDGRYGWAYPVWQYANYHSIYRDNYYEIFENSNVLPRAFLVSSYKVLTGKQEIINMLFAKDFDRGKTIILEQEPITKPQEGTGSVDMTEYQPTYATMAVNSPVPKLLFLSDVYDSGWKAFVDGKQVPLYRADYDFRAIPVPTGFHKVQLVYNPESFRLGLFAAAVVILLLVIGSTKKIFYAHRHI